MLQYSVDEHEFIDAEPEDVARRGHHHQTRSRQASIGHAKLHTARNSDEVTEKKQTNRYITLYVRCPSIDKLILLHITCGYQCDKAVNKIHTISEVIRYHFTSE